nr:MAG TPA: hypothetical protein [Caudoviricetes sp.]
MGRGLQCLTTIWHRPFIHASRGDRGHSYPTLARPQLHPHALRRAGHESIRTTVADEAMSMAMGGATPQLNM